VLRDDRFFNPTHRDLAQSLYETVRDLPIISPHGHVNPTLFADPNARFGSPVDLLIIPDHYIFRMLYAAGMPLEALGIMPRNGDTTHVETDHRTIWRTFADHLYLFRGTPTGIWLTQELHDVFDVHEKLTPQSADRIYDHIATCLQSPEFTPRALYDRFNIEVLCTTDAASSSLDAHRTIRDSKWNARVLPTFRPDDVVKINRPGWHERIDRLSAITDTYIHNYQSFLDALRERRNQFRRVGATATDHDLPRPPFAEIAGYQKTAFNDAISGKTPSQANADFFEANIIFDMAQMSVDDGMVMQLHIGSYRNHNNTLFHRFGPDTGADIPMLTEFTHNTANFLSTFGNNPNFTLILFTLDESTYSRELAPLAGHYPALKLGPPWWFHDSLNGMRRYFDRVIETAGIYNTVGFNDDTRAFPSIPARHDVWRRATADYLAGLLSRGIIDEEDAHAMILDLAYNLAKETYHL
jgi:glucuronate isomerase